MTLEATATDTSASNDAPATDTANPGNTTVHGVSQRDSMMDRAESLKERLRSLNPEPANDSDDGDDEGDGVREESHTPALQSESATVDDSDPRAVRAKRLEAMRAREAERRQQRQQEQPSAAARLRELEEQNTQLRAMTAELESLSDPVRFMEAAKKRGVDPTLIADFISEAKDPATLAAKTARSQLDPVLAEFKAEIEAVKQENAELRAERKREAQAREIEAATENFLKVVSDKTHPLTASLVAKHGRQRLHQVFARLGDQTSEDTTLEEFADLVEEELESYQLASAPSTTDSTQSPSAAAKAPPTNRATSGRSTPREGSAKRTTVEDRVDALKRRLRAAKS